MILGVKQFKLRLNDMDLSEWVEDFLVKSEPGKQNTLTVTLRISDIALDMSTKTVCVTTEPRQ